MMDNARHVPGSTRSCTPVLSQSATHARRFQALSENADKMRKKRRQNRECDFFNTSRSTTYNFIALKCPHFPPPLNLNPNLTLNRLPIPLSGPIPFRTREPNPGPQLRPIIPIPPITPIYHPAWQINYHHCTKRDKTGRIPTSSKRDHVVAMTYDDTSFPRPIFRAVDCDPLSCRLSIDAIRVNSCRSVYGKNRNFP
jgi:hypothetical protein